MLYRAKCSTTKAHKRPVPCRLDEGCTYNAPNFVSALILSVVTQQTIGARPLALVVHHPEVVN